eukprot:m51a1_g10642 hypothetical protein (330) ;mRNA; f:19715-20984
MSMLNVVVDAIEDGPSPSNTTACAKGRLLPLPLMPSPAAAAAASAVVAVPASANPAHPQTSTRCGNITAAACGEAGQQQHPAQDPADSQVAADLNGTDGTRTTSAAMADAGAACGQTAEERVEELLMMLGAVQAELAMVKQRNEMLEHDMASMRLVHESALQQIDEEKQQNERHVDKIMELQCELRAADDAVRELSAKASEAQDREMEMALMQQDIAKFAEENLSLRKLFQTAKKRASAMEVDVRRLSVIALDSEIAQLMHVEPADVDDVIERYFCQCVLLAKTDLVSSPRSRSRSVTLSADDLFERALADGVGYTEFPSWIRSQLSSS